MAIFVSANMALAIQNFSDSIAVPALKVGSQGVGGVTFFNGTIVNETTDSDTGADMPVTFGDNVRIDGAIYRTETGGDYPIKLADSMIPDTDDTYSLGTADNRFKDGYFSGTLTVETLAPTTISGSGLITTDLLTDSAVTGDKIGYLTVVSGNLAKDSVTTGKILDGTIATSDLANQSVSAAKIADGAVNSAKLADGSIATADLGTGIVYSGHISDRTVHGNKLTLDAIDSSDLILDGIITGSDISSSTSLSVSGITSSGNITVSGTVDGVDVSAIPDSYVSQSSPSWDARTGVVAISPASCQPESSSTVDREYLVTPSRIYPLDTAAVDFYCPVSLPNGVTVTEFLVWVADDSGAQNMSVALQRVDMSAQSTSALATLTSSGQPDHTSYSTTSIDNADVDNYTYSYALDIDFNVTNGAHMFEGAYITYSYTQPY